MRQFLRGVRELVGSLRWWSRLPGPMALGLVPILIVSTVFLAAFITLMILLPGWLTSLTPWAESWAPLWRGIFRGAVQVAVGVGLILLMNATMVATALAIGDPFYERIWRAVEVARTGQAPDEGYSFAQSLADSFRMFCFGVMAAIIAGVLSLIPLVGGVVGFIVGALFAGWAFATELTSRALTHRGFARRERKALLRTQRGRVFGFGVAAQLCTMVPLLAIVTVPTAVAGSTALVHDLLAATGQAPTPRPLSALYPEKQPTS